MKMVYLAVTDAEHSEILAALRTREALKAKRVELFGQKAELDAFEEIASNGDKNDPLTADEIDALCMKINIEATEEAPMKIADLLSHARTYLTSRNLVSDFHYHTGVTLAQIDDVLSPLAELSRS